MTFIIGAACVDLKDRACVQECPVDCIYEGERKLYINPDECIDCGACEPVCPVEAIISDRELSDDFDPHLTDSATFFQTVLPGRTEPIGAPGGARQAGPIAADTDLVRSLPDRTPNT
ncbi:ferredoxin [Streptomyces sp. NPDC057582]|uniref:ferredoxin n=1 Tax=Streptomyces sp. NPDC057582 TaxID=3346174 RepID=UPI0036856638